MDGTTFEGPLQKPGVIPGRKKRVWCVLSGNELLFYPENKRSSCIGSVDLALVQSIDKASSSKKGNEFQIKYDGKVTVYTADDREKCEEWIQKISQAVAKFSGNKSVLSKEKVKTQNKVEQELRDIRRQLSGEHNPQSSIHNRIKAFQADPPKSSTPLSPTKLKGGSFTDTPVSSTTLKDQAISNINKDHKVISDKTKSSAPNKSDEEKETNVLEIRPKKQQLSAGSSLKQDQQTRLDKVSRPDSEGQVSKPDFDNQVSRPDSKGQVSKPDFDNQVSKPDSEDHVSRPDSEDHVSRPDSGYETLVGCDHRNSLVQTDYGEVDISQVVLRKSRRSIPSLSQINPSSEMENNTMKQSNEENLANSHKKNVSNSFNEPIADDDKSGIEICTREKEEYSGTKNDKKNHSDNAVILRTKSNQESPTQTIQDKQITIVEPSDVSSADKATIVQIGSALSNKNGGEGILTAEQEDLLFSMNFDPIPELPNSLESVHMNMSDFTEIHDFLDMRIAQRKSGRNEEEGFAVENLRKFLEKV